MSSPPPPWPGVPGPDADPTMVRRPTAPSPGPPDEPEPDPRVVRAAQRARRRRNARRGIIVVLVCGVAVLLGIVGGAVARYQPAGPPTAAPPTAPATNTPATGTTPSPSTSPSLATATDPAGAVRGFLEAVAHGDAGAALAYGQHLPADTSMITDELLAQAHLEHPITEINVPPGPTTALDDGDSTEVTASYKIGAERVTQSFTVVRSGSRFVLRDVVAEVDVASRRSVEVPLLVAGHEVDSDTLTLLPGAYPVSSGLDNVDWAQRTVLVKAPDSSVDTSRLQLELTDAGRDALLTTVRDAVSACVDEHDLAPADCPFSYTTNDTVRAKTITWSLATDPFVDAEPRLARGSDTVGELRLNLRLSLTYEATGADKRTIERKQTVSAYPTATVDLTAEDLTITWRR